MTDFSDEEIKTQQHKFEETKASDVKEANEASREAVKQMIFVATVFMTASFFVFQINDPTHKLIGGYKFVMIASWVSFVLSMGAGIWQLYLDSNYFVKWATAKDHIIQALVDGSAKNYQNLQTISTNEQGKIPLESSMCPMWIEIFFLLLGIIFLLVVMGKLI